MTVVEQTNKIQYLAMDTVAFGNWRICLLSLFYCDRDKALFKEKKKRYILFWADQE